MSNLFAKVRPGIPPRYNRIKTQELAAEKAQNDALTAARREVALLERVTAARAARDDLLKFTQFTMPDPEDIGNVHKSRYEAAAFHRAVANSLMAVERGDITQLIFCMPPRHGKTELATKRLAAWYSGRHPEHDIIVAAASDVLSMDFGGDVRSILGSPPFKQVFPAYKLRKGGNAKDNMVTDRGGRLIFAGRGGTINGRGAHLLLMDDIFKDAAEARSQTIRDQAWEWFTKVALYRRMGKRLTILTMTRWHSDDIIGRITDPENPHYNAIEASKWKIIRLPGLAEEDDPLGRQPGEALWPDPRKDGTAFDTEYHLGNQRRDPLGFAALTQQRPTVADGVTFRRENIQRYTPGEEPPDMRFYCASDHAVSEKQRADFTCLGKFGVDKQDNIYVLDVFWSKVATDKAVEAMLAMGGGNRPPIFWWAGKDHITGSIGPFLYKRMQETGVYLNIVQLSEAGDKEQKAQSIAGRVAMGKVYVPFGPPWAERLIDQMLAFPNGTHDDAVDMMSNLGRGLQYQHGPSVPKKKDTPVEGTMAWLKTQDKLFEDARRTISFGSGWR